MTKDPQEYILELVHNLYGQKQASQASVVQTSTQAKGY